MPLKDFCFELLMEEDASSSMVSTAKMNIMAAETSNSLDSNCTFRSSKRPKLDNNINNAVVASNVAKFKGVVPQQNGHWGAQIYANHQRIWLGTFKSEMEAAMAYDSAAIKLRSGDSHRNFPWTDHSIQEPNFQNQHSLESILSMIREGSYQPKFAEFLRTQSRSQRRDNIGTSSVNVETRVHYDGKFSLMQLFQKELTPSDVGKLNRLVIPKKFAVKYFPYICESSVDGDDDDERGGGSGIDDIELVFYDRQMKCWKFRYCYWRSSQSFVFTRGWNRFVKEKNLKEKDIVTFYTCLSPNNDHQPQQQQQQEGPQQHFYLIDITYGGDGKSNCGGVDQQIEGMHEELELNLGQSIKSKVLQKDGEKRLEEEKVLSELESIKNVKEDGLKLFGVRIN